MSLALNATKREGKPEVAREAGLIPAVVYGKHIDAQSVAVPYTAFEKTYEEAGETGIIDLAVEGGENINVMIKDLQFDPVKGKILHIDFRAIKAGEAITVTVPLVFVGNSQAEKEGGTLVKQIDSLQVTGIPNKMMDEIEIDLSGLVDYDASITISDITLPEGLTIDEDPNGLVVKVVPPVSEEKLKAMEEDTASVEDIQVEEKGKKEEGDAEKSE